MRNGIVSASNPQIFQAENAANEANPNLLIDVPQPPRSIMRRTRVFIFLNLNC